MPKKNELLDLPASKTAYVYDSKGREYLGEVQVYLQLDRTYALPANVIEAQPPKDLKPYTYPRRNERGDGWDVVSDYRGIMLWNKTTARPVPNTLKLGDPLPESLTVIKPPTFAPDEHKAPKWDSQAQAWGTIPDYSRVPLWVKATAEPCAPLPLGDALPDTLTTLTPPRGEHIGAVWDEEENCWNAVPDWRGFHYWLSDGSFHSITKLGEEPPEGYLTEPPLWGLP